MYLKISPQLSQKLKLSPQMVQSIGLLSLSITELEQAVRQELEENPVLEERGDILEEQTPLEESESESLDWTQYTSLSSIGKAPKESTQQYAERTTPVSESLRDHLIWQVSLSDFSDHERKILQTIIHYIDEDGYLRESMVQLSKKNQWSSQEAESLLSRLQDLDPSGVGARNLKECLIIQARRLEEDTKDLIHLITHHLEDLKTKNYKRIARLMKLDLEEVEDMVGIITSMEPKPGRLFSTSQTQYIIPDVFIYKKNDGSYQAVMNEEGIPQIRVASHYTQFLSQMSESKNKDVKAKEYLIDKMRRALAFIRSMNQRRQNILRLTQVIAEEQKDFFDRGERFLKPLLLKEMSQKIGLHISTVSRLTTNKFVHTPQGVFEFKHFFGISYMNKNGEKISVAALKSFIKKMIEQEKKPLSDEKITQMIYDSEGVQLTRRQVARFREGLDIPSTRYRQK